jgi:hypothetical protein
MALARRGLKPTDERPEHTLVFLPVVFNRDITVKQNAGQLLLPILDMNIWNR